MKLLVFRRVNDRQSSTSKYSATNEVKMTLKTIFRHRTPSVNVSDKMKFLKVKLRKLFVSFPFIAVYHNKEHPAEKDLVCS